MVLWCGERHVLETQPSRSYPNLIFLLFVLCASDRRVILIHINGGDDPSKSIPSNYNACLKNVFRQALWLNYPRIPTPSISFSKFCRYPD